MIIKKTIRKLHRQIGVFAALWLLVLSTTGLILQHSDEWGLGKLFIRNALILELYGIGQNFSAYEVNNNSLVQVDKNLIINNVKLYFPEVIEKVAIESDHWIVVTENNQSWFNQQGQLLQSFDEFDLLPTNDEKKNWIHSTDNKELKQKAIRQTSDGFLSVEKLIYDIHAGITTSSLINDLAAIALIILSLSGVLLFFRKKR